MEKKIAIVGTCPMGSLVARSIIEKYGVDIEVVKPEDVKNPAFEPPPIMYKAPEIYVNNYFTPPLTRKQRRANERKNKKKS